MTGGGFFLQRLAFAALAAMTLILPPGARAADEPVRILQAGSGAASRSIVLQLNKAIIVELPVEARDVLVANPAIVDAVVRTPRRTYLLGQQPGTTNAFFFDAEGKQILAMEIRVEGDMGALDAAIKKYIPGSNIRTEWLKDSIVLTGTAPSAADADRARSIAVRYLGDETHVFSMVTIGGNEQVMLKVRVAEMQRTVAKQLGVNLDALVGAGEVGFNLVTANPFSASGSAMSSAVSRVFDLDNRRNRVDAQFQALERHGLLRTLAEPTLTAISGENAKFLAGGEFPIPASRDRDGNVTIDYKQFGVGLAFTPVVLSEGRISLRISTEVSELQQEGSFTSSGGTITSADGTVTQVSGLTIPALRVRRAETTVELPSGGSLVMAGLLQQATKQSLDALPGLKELPVLGALFQSRDYINNETELVVIVTPYMVGPTTMDALRLPTDGYVTPTDFETIFLGRLNAVYGKGGPAPQRKRLEGPVGFILE